MAKISRENIITISIFTIWIIWLSYVISGNMKSLDMKEKYANTEQLCVLSNITYEEYVCVDNVGNCPKYCLVGSATWIILRSNNISSISSISSLIQKWDSEFTPSIGAKRKCWYYDDKISLSSPEILLKKHSEELGVIGFLLFIMNTVITLGLTAVYNEGKPHTN